MIQAIYKVVHILIDHKPFALALKSNSKHNPRQLRHLDFISKFTNGIHCIKDTEISVADAL